MSSRSIGTTGMSMSTSTRTSSHGSTNGNGSITRGRPIMTSEAGREQTLRDYKLTIEYKHLKQHAPSGVYLVPSIDAIRKLYGVIFIRKGMSMYANGIFKFILTLPLSYNSINSWPTLRFTTRVYNPHVHPETGELDFKYEYSTWDPHRHYLVTILTYVKKIFYLDFSSCTILPTETQTQEGSSSILPTAESKQDFFVGNYVNHEAVHLARTNPDAFRAKVDECVHSSREEIYINHPDCTIVFNEPSICHQILVDILQRELIGDDESTATGKTMANRDKVLQCVSTAHNSAFGDLTKI